MTELATTQGHSSTAVRRKPRKIRIHISGGISDVLHLSQRLKVTLNSHEFNGTNWEIDFDNLQRFGDVGPLHKASLGFVEATTSVHSEA